MTDSSTSYSITFVVLYNSKDISVRAPVVYLSAILQEARSATQEDTCLMLKRNVDYTEDASTVFPSLSQTSQATNGCCSDMFLSTMNRSMAR